LTITSAGIFVSLNNSHQVASVQQFPADGTSTSEGYELAGSVDSSGFLPSGGTASGTMFVGETSGQLHGGLDFQIDLTAGAPSLWQVFGSGSITARDALLFQGPSELAQLQFRYTLSLASDQSIPSGPCTDLPFAINAGTKAIATGSLTIGETLVRQSVTGSACTESSTNVLATGLFSVNRGYTLNVDSTLQLISNITQSGAGLSESIVDAGHTMKFFIDPVTDGAFYTSASGNDYRTLEASPVPEPASLFLLGGGLMALGRARKRK
jgi:hypothetical protein